MYALHYFHSIEDYFYINRIKAMAKSHTYHMFPFEDRPPPSLSGSDTCRPSP